MKNNRKVIFLLLNSIVFFYCSCIDYTDNKLKLYNDTQTNYFYRLKKDTLLLSKDVDYINEELRFAVANIHDTSIPTFAFKTMVVMKKR